MTLSTGVPRIRNRHPAGHYSRTNLGLQVCRCVCRYFPLEELAAKGIGHLRDRVTAKKEGTAASTVCVCVCVIQKGEITHLTERLLY